MINTRQVVFLAIFLLFNVPTYMIRDRMAREVNVQTVGGGRQFRRSWWTWTGSKQIELWRLHRRYYPNSSLRIYLAAIYVLAVAWIFVVSRWLW